MKPKTIGYLIRPLERTVQRVYLNDYRDIYRHGQFECFDCATFNEQGDGCYVDDEGLLKPQSPDNFFWIEGRPEPLCGNGVVLGVDAEGESVEPSVNWETFKQLVEHVTVLRDARNGFDLVRAPLQFIDDIVPYGWESV